MKVTRDAETVRLAHKYADSTRPRQRGGPWSFTDAMARAPWASARGDLGSERESEFRRAFAERLVERKLALPVGRSRTSGPSGTTDLKGRLVYMSQAELDETAARAHREGLSWSTWARRRLTER